MTEKKKDGILESIFVYIVVIAVCAAVCGGIGAFWYLLVPSPRHSRMRRRNMEIARQDRMPDMKRRFYIGSAAGAVLGIGASIALRRKFGK